MTNDATTPEAIAGRYDTIAYDALPCPVAHPDHVAAIATMFGLTPAAVATARVLDVGCNDGTNLLPMAARLPRATFVGCDIAPRAIAAAREAATALALANVRFVESDLTAFEGGPFDYVIAHGMYSWVSAPVRDALLALARRMLAPNGILFVSYNTYPGGFLRRAAWEALHWHTRGLDPTEAKLGAARELAGVLVEADSAVTSEAWLRNEFKRIADQSDSELFHDTLGQPNEPVWFHAFAEHAERHGLTYVAEAVPSMMAGGGLAPRIRQFLASKPRLAREQYLDLARSRRFRQSLLCRSEAASDFDLAPARLHTLAVSASMALMRAASEGRYPSLPGPSGEVLRRLLERLVEAAPTALPAADLLERLRKTQGTPEILLDAWVSGFAQLHAYPPEPAHRASAQPRALAIARWQATRRDAVTNLRHETIRLPDPATRALLVACDGTRDRAALAGVMTSDRDVGTIDETLAMFARYALLERD